MTFTPHETPIHLPPADAPANPSLLGKVMFLVAAALAFLAVGAFLGRGLSPGAGLFASLGAFGLLLIQAFGGQQFRVGPFAVGWLFFIGFALGLGLGPVLHYYVAADPGTITQAAVTTALVVALMGATGFALDKDLSSWMRPVSFLLLGLIALSFVLFIIGSGGSPLLSLAIAGISAVLILLDLNYLRRHGTPDDAVLLATGLFISVINIFLSLLNVFGRDG